MNLQQKFQPLFDALPDTLPSSMTFMEIAGYPHYENVCSNILKFYFNPKTRLHGLDDLLLKSLLQCINVKDKGFLAHEEIKVKREVPTSSGRIDLVIYTNNWVIAIENKIRHFLDNDLDEYALFLDKEHNGKQISKIVLSVKPEKPVATSGFVNLTYKRFINQIEKNLETYSGDVADQYYLFFKHFLQTIKNMYMPIVMEQEEIDFLLNNQENIAEIIQLENKLSTYINQRANFIKNNVKSFENITGWVYANYDVGFHFTYNDTQYKIECPIERHGISITICVEINKVDKVELEKLDYFKKNPIENFPVENNRLVIKKGIPFNTSNEDLISILESFLEEIKITEHNNDEFKEVTNEQLN